MKPNPKVGQILWSANTGNRAGRHQPVVLQKMTVKNVGRKYFSCEVGDHNYTVEFNLGSWREKTDYTPGYQLYETRQEWMDENERSTLMSDIEDCFSMWSPRKKLIPLKILREIQRLIPPKLA